MSLISGNGARSAWVVTRQRLSSTLDSSMALTVPVVGLKSRHGTWVRELMVLCGDLRRMRMLDGLDGAE